MKLSESQIRQVDRQLSEETCLYGCLKAKSDRWIDSLQWKPVYAAV